MQVSVPCRMEGGMEMKENLSYGLVPTHQPPTGTSTDADIYEPCN